MTNPIQTGQRLLFLLAVLCAGLVRLPGQDFGDLIQQMRDLRNRDWGRPDREDAAAERAEARRDAAEAARARGYNSSYDNANRAIDGNDADALEAAAREMLRLYPGDKVGLEYLGMSYLFRGDYGAAEQYYEKARSAGLKRSRWRVLMYDLRVHQGFALVNAGSPAEAEPRLREALGIRDDQGETWNALGVALVRQGKFDEARKAYERALKLEPNTPLYHQNLESLNQAQQQLRADAEFQRADHAAATAALGQLREAVGRAPAGGNAPASGLALASGDQAAAMDAWTDSGVVDLRGTVRTAPNPAVLGTPAPGPGRRFVSDLRLAPPPDPRLVTPLPQDIELLFPPPPPSRWPGPQRPANQPKLVNPLDHAPLPPDKQPQDSDIDFLFPGAAAQQEEDMMLQGLIEMTAKLPTNVPARAPAPPVQPAVPNPLKTDHPDGPHN